MTTYSIGEVAKMIGISISTLRYYDKEGILPLVNRTNGNIRVFDDHDLQCLKVIECLKHTGLQLKEIKQYFEWCQEGDSTIDQRYELFLQQKERTRKQIETLQKSLDLIDYKCEFYRIAKENRSTNVPGSKDVMAMKFLQEDAKKKETEQTEIFATTQSGQPALTDTNHSTADGPILHKALA